jgi:hypothetical protein
MLQHAQRVSGNVSQTCRFFGVWRALFYIWKHRYEKHGVGGLRDLPRRPHNIRFRIAPEIVSLIFAFGRSAVTAPFESVSIFNGINRRSRQHSKLVITNHSCVRV